MAAKYTLLWTRATEGGMMVACETRGQTVRLGVWESRLRIGAEITREGGHEALTLLLIHILSHGWSEIPYKLGVHC